MRLRSVLVGAYLGLAGGMTVAALANGYSPYELFVFGGRWIAAFAVVSAIAAFFAGPISSRWTEGQLINWRLAVVSAMAMGAIATSIMAVELMRVGSRHWDQLPAWTFTFAAMGMIIALLCQVGWTYFPNRASVAAQHNVLSHAISGALVGLVFGMFTLAEVTTGMIGVIGLAFGTGLGLLVPRNFQRKVVLR